MKIQLKNKFINHFLQNGNKKKCEGILLKSFKNLQKFSKKPYKKVVKLAIINASPVFRIVMLRKKKRKKQKFVKEVPTFVTSKFERISWGLKYILHLKNFSINLCFSDYLKKELLLNAQNSKNSINIKINNHKKAIEKQRFLLYFRW